MRSKTHICQSLRFDLSIIVIIDTKCTMLYIIQTDQDYFVAITAQYAAIHMIVFHRVCQSEAQYTVSCHLLFLFTMPLTNSRTY